MSFITEEGSFLPNMTPDQYADFIIDFFPRFDRQHYGKLLKFFEIDPYAPIRTFSKGQKSKVEFSAGFSKRARYILMDEPFLGKDMFTRRNLLKLMISSLSDNETVLISTHLIEEIENVIDRAIILSYGRIKADFYMDDLRQEGKNLADVMSEISGYNEDRLKQIFKSRE
jgi:ABC-2 type transport system ATP-binding protein